VSDQLPVGMTAQIGRGGVWRPPTGPTRAGRVTADPSPLKGPRHAPNQLPTTVYGRPLCLVAVLSCTCTDPHASSDPLRRWRRPRHGARTPQNTGSVTFQHDRARGCQRAEPEREAVRDGSRHGRRRRGELSGSSSVLLMRIEARMPPADSCLSRSDPISSWSSRHRPSCSSAPTEQIVERYGDDATT